jgi:hypothetical protein
VKAIAEEIRGLAIEFNVPIVTATQTTRSGYDSSDVSLSDTSESYGVNSTADLMFALIATEEMQEMNQILVKQLKNRYSDPNSNRRFIIGVDRAKMRLYDVDDSVQEGILEGPDTSVFDSTPFGNEETERNKKKPKFNKKAFENFR